MIVLIGMVFVIIWEMFLGGYLIASAFAFRERVQVGTDVYISHRIRSSLTYLHGFQLIVLLPWFIEITFFQLQQGNKSSESKIKFRQPSNHCKRVQEAANLHTYAYKTKESITSQKPGCRDFWWIACSVLNKGKSALPPLFNGPEVLSSASDKSKLFTKNFSENSYLDDSVSLYCTCFPF